MSKYLVTGGAGFIGSNIVGRLLKLGGYVRVIDNFSTGKRENIEEFIGDANFELIEGDFVDLDTARKSVKGMDFVLHYGALTSVSLSILDPMKADNSNIIGTLNLLTAAKEEGIKKFIYTSSCAVYGDNPDLPQRENSPINPISPYALTKYAGERYAQLFWRIYKLPTISLRYFNVFGPKQDPHSQYAAVIPRFITTLLEGRRTIIYGTGEQSRDFTYVDNVVKANLLAIKAKSFGDVFNIASGKETKLNRLLKLLQDIIGVKARPKYLASRSGDILHSRANIFKAKKILNYSPKVGLKEGLIKTVEWFKQHE